ncbi:hypothetical protein PAP_03290 [Palaeococcus pacificus DY20341]|uniref:Gins51 C-terminal domain-containing protein n=1 Tax=Palaeococcus pacificus DY20341 TaxID=1343739 RepID=A0A075LWZ5_9EURY|nr:hypothetical protein PAP_03290 [Palaeococcus pacificus DY20341]
MDILRLRELLERELASNELEPLDDEFYKEFDSLVKALEFKADSSKERGDEIEERLSLAELKIAKELMGEIIRIRLHKIVDLAVKGVPASLPGDEHKVFNMLVSFINREPVAIHVEEKIVEKKFEEEKIEAKRAVREAYLIEIDIPKVLDADLNEYGPFKKGDLVVLPLQIAAILLERKAAKRIRISP